MRRALPRLVLIAAGLAAPLAAPAQTPAASADQATALQEQIRGWAAELLGKPALPPPVRVTPEGDQYRLAIAIGDLPGWSGAGAITATARPLDGGRWAIDDIRFPQPAAFHVDLPATKARPAGPLDVAITIAEQDSHAVIDPSFATPTTASSRIGRYDIVFAGSALRGLQHFDAGTAALRLAPGSGGRLDFGETATAHGLSLTQDAGKDGAPLQMKAGDFALSAHLEGIDAPRFLPALRAVAAFGSAAAAEAAAPATDSDKAAAPATDADKAAAPAAGAGKAAAKAVPDRAALRALYLAWRGMVTGGGLEESLDKVHLIAAGHEVSLDRLAIGGGASTPDGTLAAQVSLAIDGLASPEIPAAFHDFVPRHILLRPSLSAVNLADLDALIMTLTDPDAAKTDPTPEIAALFAHGGITAGLDALELDVGPARLTGTGKVTALGPDRLVGDAALRMTGFDALAREIDAIPAFAGAGPFVAMARGLARPEGDAMVWHITASDGEVKVNDTDMTALLGQAKREHKRAP